MTLNIGHRGFGNGLVENSLTAFKKAIQHKLDMVELDVRLTKDEEVVVFHDSNLKRLGGVKVNIDAIEWIDLQKIQLVSKIDKQIYTEKIPSLKEVLEVAEQKIKLNIEIKEIQTNKLVLIKKIVQLIKEFNLSNEVIVSSFHDEMLELISYEDDSIPCGFLFYKPYKIDHIFSKNYSLFSIHPHKHLTTKKLIQEANQRNIKLIPWTVNSNYQLKKLARFQVYGIITNYPDKLTKIIKAQWSD